MKQRMQFTPKKRGIPDPMAQRMVELDALNAMTMVINQSVEMDTLLDVAVSHVFQPLGYEQLAILLDTIGNNELTLAASRGLSDLSSIIDLGRCVIELENSSESILNLQDLPIENEYVRQSSQTSQLMFSIPLIGSCGLLGLILLGDNSNNHLDRETEKLLFSLGRQIAVGLEKVSLIEETQNWAEQLEKRVDQKTATISLVNALNEALNRDDPLENIITQVNQTLQKTFDAVATSIETIDRDQNHFDTGKTRFKEKYFERINPSQVENDPNSVSIFSQDNLYRDILKSGQPRQFSDPVSILQLTEITTELKLKELGEKTSVYIIPLISKNSPLGLLKILRGTPFNAFEETQLSVISNQFATIIERKLTEEKLMEHDLRYRELYDSAPAAYFAVGTDGLIYRANQGALNLLGYSLDELENRPILDLYANTPAGKNRAKQVFSRFIAGDCIRDEELQMCTANNDFIWISLSIDPVLGDKGDIIEGRSIAVDITARKIAERQLHLQATALEVAANAIAITDTNGTIQWANQAFIDLTDYAREDIGTKNLNLLPLSQHETYPELWAKVKAGEIWSGEITNKRKDNSEYIVEMTLTPVEDEDGEITHFIAIKQDISERAHAQKELQRQVEELKALHKFATHGVEIVDEDILIEMATEIIQEQMGPNNFGVLLVNEQLDVLHHHHSYQRASESQSYLEIPIGAGLTGQVALTGEPLRVADIRTEASYIEAYRDIQSEICVPLRIGERIIGVINAESIIRDRFSKADQRFLSTLAAQLATAIERVRFYNSESKRRQIYETLVQSLDTLNSTLQLDDVLRVILEELSKVLHHDTATVQLQTNGKVEIVSSRGFNYPERVEGLLLPMDLQFPSHKVIENGEPLSVSDIVEDYPSRQDSLYISESEQVRSWLGLPLIVKNNSIGMIAVERTQIDPFLPDDINLAMAFANQAASAIENARLFSEADKRLQRLASLRNIDQAISNSLDLFITLNIVLNEVIEQLNVDAAAALLYQRDIQSIKYAAGLGFNRTEIQDTYLRIGQGYPGIAVLERRVICMPRIDYKDNQLVRAEKLKNEKFVSYFGVPLVAKGQVVGVIEVFNRTPIDPDNEWISFLETLAGQAAIAIDNINLFDFLQRSNDELILAYDATIEGWAKTLEIRDVETEGHSRRVVDLTIQLANCLGIHGEDLAHMRRGALLHDIGKIGIPDSILYKPGPLNTEEWTLMRKHPVYAYQLLSSINFLRPALDIPYCHHEKWDGTGYPRGLVQDQIPLAARIFSLVDVWDALISDRPYRDAWDEQQTLNYIEEQSGKHFDPAVVNAFIELHGTNIL